MGGIKNIKIINSLYTKICSPGAYLVVVKLVSDYVRNINFIYFLRVFSSRERIVFAKQPPPVFFRL